MRKGTLERKKRIISVALCVCLLAVAAMGTIAYFTDSEEANNVFTVGKVDVELIESYYHREASCMENVPADATPYPAGTVLTNEEIIAGSGKAYTEYLAGSTLMPGVSINKMPYVKNTGNTDAYVRIRVMIPAALDKALYPSMYTQSAMDEGEFTFAYGEKDGNMVYEFTRVDPLAAGEMTFWNVWGSIHMDPSVTNETIDALIDAKLIDAETGKFEVLVEADAIQADGFDSAAEAWTAYAAA